MLLFFLFWGRGFSFHFQGTGTLGAPASTALQAGGRPQSPEVLLDAAQDRVPHREPLRLRGQLQGGGQQRLRVRLRRCQVTVPGGRGRGRREVAGPCLKWGSVERLHRPALGGGVGTGVRTEVRCLEPPSDLKSGRGLCFRFWSRSKDWMPPKMLILRQSWLSFSC